VDPFLDRVATANGLLHISFDADFLDPGVAPGVSAPVPGGATAYEARRIMEILHESALVTSLDVAELNPALDERGRTTLLLIDLIASLMGRRSIDHRARTVRPWRKTSMSFRSSASTA
jgi:arginase